MTEHKHTPGPWCINRTRNGRMRYILPGDDPSAAWRGILIAEIMTYLPQEENEANGRLIAAAPDLLAACERAARSYHHPTCINGKRGDGTGCDCHVGPAQAAITKAKGE